MTRRLAPRGLLLDLDGTIADSIEFFYGLACEMTRAANCALPERAAVLDAIANGVVPHERFLPADLPDREAFLARLYQEQGPRWVERYGAETEPLSGALEAVRILHGRGLRLALVTSSMGSLPFLDRWEVRELFDTVVSREDVRRIKPDPESLLLALDRLRLTPPQALHVGDTPLDVRAGSAAGVETIGVLTGAGTEAQLRAAGAVRILPSLRALPDFLDESDSGNDS
jgi:HAD superfamily hydrolase (TIGR01509 family)